MDGNHDHQGEEGIPASCVDKQISQPVIVKYPVIQALTGGALTIDILPFIAATLNTGIESDIVRKRNVDTAAIVRHLFLAELPVLTFPYVSTCKRTAILVLLLDLVKLGKDHSGVVPAADIAIRIIGKSLRKAVRIQRGLHIEINDRNDTVIG